MNGKKDKKNSIDSAVAVNQTVTHGSLKRKGRLYHSVMVSDRGGD